MGWTSVSVIVPWNPDSVARSSNWAAARDRLSWLHPGWEIVEQTPPSGRFNRSAALNAGVQRASFDTIVVCYADTFAAPEWLRSAVADVQAGIVDVAAPAVSCRLDRFATADLVERWADDPTAVPSLDGVEERRLGWTGIAVTRRQTLDRVRFDEHFDGWGYAERAWLLVCRHLGCTVDEQGEAWHLWHPTGPQRTWASWGAAERRWRFDRYHRAAVAGDTKRLMSLAGIHNPEG